MNMQRLKEKLLTERYCSAYVTFKCNECGHTWDVDMEDSFESAGDFWDRDMYGYIECPECESDDIEIDDVDVYDDRTDYDDDDYDGDESLTEAVDYSKYDLDHFVDGGVHEEVIKKSPLSVIGLFTNKKWEDGIPVVKYFDRDENKVEVKLNKGEKVLVSNNYPELYKKYKNGWVRIDISDLDSDVLDSYSNYYDESLTEGINFHDFFMSAEFEQDVLKKLPFTSDPIKYIPASSLYKVKDYLADNFESIKETISEFEADGVSKRDIVSYLEDDINELGIRNNITTLAYIVYYSVKCLTEDYRADESLNEAKKISGDELSTIDTDNYLISSNNKVWFAGSKDGDINKAYYSPDEGETWYKAEIVKKNGKNPRTQKGKADIYARDFKTTVGRNRLVYYRNNPDGTHKLSLDVDHENDNYTDDTPTNLRHIPHSDNVKKAWARKKNTLTEAADDIIWSSNGTQDYISGLPDKEKRLTLIDRGYDPEMLDGSDLDSVIADDDYMWQDDSEEFENYIVPMINQQTADGLVILSGTAGTWQGNRPAIKIVNTEDLVGGDICQDCNIIRIIDDGEGLVWEASHHDGTHRMKLFAFPEEYELEQFIQNVAPDYIMDDDIGYAISQVSFDPTELEYDIKPEKLEEFGRRIIRNDIFTESCDDKITEAREWGYKLETGKALRNAIDSDDGQLTLHVLKDCLEEIKKFSGKDFDWQFGDIKEDVDLWINDEDVDVETVNYILNNFYDACDAYNIWISI